MISNLFLNPQIRRFAESDKQYESLWPVARLPNVAKFAVIVNHHIPLSTSCSANKYISPYAYLNRCFKYIAQMCASSAIHQRQDNDATTHFEHTHFQQNLTFKDFRRRCLPATPNHILHFPHHPLSPLPQAHFSTPDEMSEKLS